MDGIFNLILVPVYILDASVFTLMIILAVLSKRIGEALRVPHFYQYYYTCSALIIVLVAFDMFFAQFIKDETARNEIFEVTIALRAGLVFSTLPVAMIYWRWLFLENIKK
ncbi:MAG: hypothetical protein LBH98_04035 [Chitinispirillales bacterium]|jgi:hypothetical protein|nr:hypothetical protein [Chitinispirillales bacterium]